MSLPTYDQNAKCPKCKHDDVATRYVKQDQGGRYGDPCEFYPKEISKHEHIHRYCRRCEYKWCEACAKTSETPKTPASTLTIPIDTSQVDPEIVKFREIVKQLRENTGKLTDLLYMFERYKAAYNLLLTDYAKFHVGSRVELVKAPLIDSLNSPGWLSSKHFLLAGARGTVRCVEIHGKKFGYEIVFDDESWLDSQGHKHVVDPSARHLYYFTESSLIAVDCDD